MTDHQQTLAELSQQARTDAGFSQQQLADQTKIPLSFIRAIEGEELGFLPDPTYCRGFIRLLCKVLQVDSSPFLDAYQRTLNNQQSISRPPKKNTFYSPEVLKARPLSFNSSKKSGNRLLWLLLLVIVVLSGLFFVTRPDDSNYPPLAIEEDDQRPDSSPPLATSPPPPETSQTLTLVVERPVQVTTVFDSEQERHELLLPQTYVFKFNHEGQIVVEDTSAVRLWFNGEEIVKLRKGGKRRRLVFRADNPTEQTPL